MSPSSTVHGGQHDVKYVTFELLLHLHSWLTKYLCLNQLVLLWSLEESHRHTAGRLMPEFRYLVIFVLNRYGILSEEYNNLVLGSDEFRIA